MRCAAHDAPRTTQDCCTVVLQSKRKGTEERDASTAPGCALATSTRRAPAWHRCHSSCAAFLAPAMSAAAAHVAAAPGGAVALCGASAGRRAASSGCRAAALRSGPVLGFRGSRAVFTHTLHRPDAAGEPFRLRRRRNCAAAATSSGRALVVVAASSSGEPRPDFATKGEFKKDGPYALKYLYDGGAPGQRTRSPLVWPGLTTCRPCARLLRVHGAGDHAQVAIRKREDLL